MAKRQVRKRRVKKNIPSGVAHIHSTFNNTIITITDPNGNAIAWSSAGALGFKDMEVINEKTGKPILKMIGKGKEIFEKLELKSIHISISHDHTHAIAHAIAEQ